MSDRWVLLVATHPRSGWFREIARWSSAATVPVELIVCTSAAEVSVLLESGRRFSALLADAGLAGLERDLLAAARQHDVPAVVVGARVQGPDWRHLGATSTLDGSFTSDDLLAALRALGRPVPETPRPTRVAAPPPPSRRAPHSRTVAVTGVPGSGTSTVARALAQGFAAEHPTLLADLALHADQALLHDVGDVYPGLPELLEACRRSTPGPAELEQLTWGAAHLSYRLLLGLRRPVDWVDIGPAALEVALDVCCAHGERCVFDVSADLEGEPETGSADLDDRNRLARSAVAVADLVVLTSRFDTRGLHRLTGLIASARSCGVASNRMLVVLVGVGAHPRQRAAAVRSVASILDRGEHRSAGADPTSQAPPAFVPWHRGVERAVRDTRCLPNAVVTPLTRTVGAVLDQLAPAEPHHVPTPEPVAPGSLGHWYQDHLQAP